MEKSARPLPRWPFALAVAVLALLPLLPALENGFVWDDEMNLTANEHFRGLGAEHLRWMATNFHGGHYQPLTWLSYALNHAAGGLHPRGYIAVNLALHALNAALVFILFTHLLPRDGHERRRLAWAVLGALFYALHPLRVESAVWVTERRDVLSLFFLLLSLLAWLRAQDGSHRRGLFYALSLLTFAASLLSKAWGIVFPAVLLILYWRPLHRHSWKKIALELAPFAVLAVGFALLAAAAQSEEAMASLDAHGWDARLMQAAWSPAFYLEKTALPLDLSPLYLLRGDFNPWSPAMIAGAAVTVVITGTLILRARRFPALLAGWLVFLVLLAPISGLAQSGSQLAADRYTYLAGIVPALGLAAAGLWASRRWPQQKKLFAVGMVVVVALLTFATTRQTQVWESADTLWSQAIEADETNYVAYFNRATTGKLGGYEGALADLDRAIELDPGYAAAYARRGEIRVNARQDAAARADLDTAISLNPAPAQPYNNRGILNLRAGKTAKAEADFGDALERDPELYEAYVNRGLLYHQQGKSTAALADYGAALALRPDVWQVYFNRGLLLAETGQTEAAIEDFTHALSLNPDFAGTYEQRALLYRKLGQTKAAEADLAAVRRLTTLP
ncbi:tetratricopeptide repeat protein [Ruficoccus amylovorans]|uniref:Tetratricopeptide repeat protein n=1 Tax=Ruficoccus amylovorans TaxID=1804625 RepID=A0A842HKV1_9BACT|nr:tetratricopeptide repeat protein [Ruficoccus amylovorans]MBC2596097.1 tetratricopeptide repeat protein [Ruficoccus amylovorans]